MSYENPRTAEVGGSVGLSNNGGRKLEDDHFKESIGGVDPLLVDTLEEILSSLQKN